MIELKGGVFLSTREDIIADQLGWDDEDPCKNMDFRMYEYWLTTDNGETPIGINHIIDLIEELS